MSKSNDILNLKSCHSRCLARLPGGLSVQGWLTASILAVTRLTNAQEALHNFLTGDNAAEARSRTLDSEQYTIKTGDFRLLAASSLGFDWNDNVNTSNNDPQEDFILRPMAHLTVSHPISRQNILSVNVGVGYDKYFEHDNYGGVRLESGSEVSLDISVKDVRINLHDRFQYTQDPASQGSVAGTARYGGFDNVAGLKATWDLRDVLLSLGYDHRNFSSLSSEFDYLDRASELIAARAGLRVHPTLVVGLEGSGAFTGYDRKFLNDNTSYSAGVYGDWHPGLNFNVQPRVGYAIYDFEQKSSSVRAVDQDSWYADLTASHQFSDAMSYSFNLGHELRLGIQADSVESWYFRPGFTWKLIKNLSLNLYLAYEHGKQGSSDQSSISEETYDWFGGGLGLNTPITDNLTVGINYRLTLRESDTATREYTQNLAGFLVTYTFH